LEGRHNSRYTILAYFKEPMRGMMDLNHRPLD
jgi:hypothetical protein